MSLNINDKLANDFNNNKTNESEEIIVKNKMFVIARPKTTSALREIYVARYPNHK